MIRDGRIDDFAMKQIKDGELFSFDASKKVHNVSCQASPDDFDGEFIKCTMNHDDDKSQE